jgi:LuxR family transcriptional regulator, quorum-sensing system regulator BjaR1
MMESLEYQRFAFEFIEKVERVANAEEVVDAINRVLAPFGFSYVTFAPIPILGERFDKAILATTPGRSIAEWHKIYSDEAYNEVDPLMHHLRRSVNPFEYQEVPFEPNPNARAAEVVRLRSDFGFRRGLVVPIRGPMGSSGFVAMGGPKPDLAAHNKQAFHLTALYAFERICCLRFPPSVQKPALTKREREVLTWVAMGKSASETGEILAITKRTVDAHARTAFLKLGAANRTHAVAIAIRDRIIAI